MSDQVSSLIHQLSTGQCKAERKYLVVFRDHFLWCDALVWQDDKGCYLGNINVDEKIIAFDLYEAQLILDFQPTGIHQEDFEEVEDDEILKNYS